MKCFRSDSTVGFFTTILIVWPCFLLHLTLLSNIVPSVSRYSGEKCVFITDRKWRPKPFKSCKKPVYLYITLCSSYYCLLKDSGAITYSTYSYILIDMSVKCLKNECSTHNTSSLMPNICLSFESCALALPRVLVKLIPVSVY